MALAKLALIAGVVLGGPAIVSVGPIDIPDLPALVELARTASPSKEPDRKLLDFSEFRNRPEQRVADAIALRAEGKDAEARTLLQRAASAAEPRGQYLLAVMMAGGQGGPADTAGAKGWLAKAAPRWPRAAELRFEPKLAARAAKLKQSAGRGDPATMYAWAISLMDGIGTRPDPDGAREWLEKAAAKHYPAAMRELAMVVGNMGPRGWEGGSDEDIARAESLLIEAGKLGDAPAFVALAKLRQEGTKQYTEWARQAAMKGDPEGAYLLGILAVPPRNLLAADEGANWLEKAVAAGHVEATVALADLFAEVPKRRSRAVELYRRAIAEGSGEAMMKLADAYHVGTCGLKCDEREALRLLRMAVSSGALNSESQLIEVLSESTEPAHVREAFDRYVSRLPDWESAASEGALLLLRDHPGIPFDVRPLVDWAVAGARRGRTEEIFTLAMLLEKGQGVVRRPDEAGALMALAAMKGHSWAISIAASSIVKGEAADSEAIKILEASAAFEDPAALGELGARYLEGRGVQRDRDRAIGYLKRGVERNDPQSQFLYGKFLCEGEGVKASPREGLRLVQAARHRGIAGALEYLLNWQIGRPADQPTRAAVSGQELVAKAQSGNPEAQHQLAHRLLGLEYPADLAEAVSWLEKAALQRYAPAQLDLARYLAGLDSGGVRYLTRFEPPDPDRGYRLLAEAASAGLPPAMTLYGQSLLAKDPPKARKLLERAAAAGEAMAMRILGADAQTRGDVPAARRWWEEAGRRGDSWSFRLLAWSWEGIDEAAALEALKAAADSGDQAATRQVADRYLEGAGTPKDPREALVWLERDVRAFHAESALDAAQLLQTGPPEVRNPVEAFHWAMEYTVLDPEGGDSNDYFGPEEGETVLTPYIKQYGNAANAHLALGLRYETGDGLERDLDMARKWYHSAAGLWYHDDLTEVSVLAQFKVAALSGEAIEIYRDAAWRLGREPLPHLKFLGRFNPAVDEQLKAILLELEDAARAGYAPASFDLGMLAAYGRGTNRDLPRAIEYFEAAGEAGFVPALCVLGQIFDPESNPEFMGYPKKLADKAKALAFYRKAATAAIAHIESKDRFEGTLVGFPAPPPPSYGSFLAAVGSPEFSLGDSNSVIFKIDDPDQKHR